MSQASLGLRSLQFFQYLFRSSPELLVNCRSHTPSYKAKYLAAFVAIDLAL
jgi:hypothetical protein